MKLSKQEKAARKAAFHYMSPAKKLEHILTYYKWPILLTLILLLVLGSVLRRELSRKEPLLYLALVNVSVGSELEHGLTSDYLDAVGADARRQEVYLYRDLYLSDDADTLNHEYAYASQMKVMGAIQAQKLDIVLMNREAYDIFSQKGYLAELPALLREGDPAAAEMLTPFLSENEVVLSDNSIEVLLGETEAENRVTVSAPNALAVGSFPLFQYAGFDGELFLGVLANSRHTEEALRYIQYLSGR